MAPADPPWPKEVIERYEPVRRLGRGAFATVVLAKRKSGNEGSDAELVAIKMVKAETNTQNHYVHREMYILQELNHPNIVKLIETWEPHDATFSATMVLSNAEGRTLDYLLVNVGAPSLTFGRVVMAQLVDAVAYLHSHAVVHRDIKPDNIMIKNISLSDRSIVEGDTEEPHWPELMQKWHLTLIDFGFARALSRKDLDAEESIKMKIKNIMRLERHESLDAPVKDKSSRFFLTQDAKPVDNASRHVVRALSALGTQQYAAPEVKNKARDSDTADDSSHMTFNGTLGSTVSDYGMIADAFSVGATARYVLTGVPPDESVEEFVANYNNPLYKVARWICRKLNKKAQRKPKKSYRSSSALPSEALQLVKGLTQPNASIRTSVRDAMRNPYIQDVLGKTTTFKKEITFLKCAQS